MDLRPFNFPPDAFESVSRPDSYFAYYHPHIPECSTCLDDQYASSFIESHECLVEAAFHLSSTGLAASLDLSDVYLPSDFFSLSEHDQVFAQRAVPEAKVSSYSELMPHVKAESKTTTPVSLKQDVRVAAKPQPCVSPALCQGHADLPECAEFDDELDCPGEPAELSDEEGELCDLPPPSPPSSPVPAPSPSLSSVYCCEPPRASRVVRSPRSQNRYSPMEVKVASARKGKSAIQRISSGSDDDEPRKPRKRREAVSLACYFCRKRKIACRQPPEGSPDRTCNQCKSRGMECVYPTESRRGARRGSAAHKHAH